MAAEVGRWEVLERHQEVGANRASWWHGALRWCVGSASHATQRRQPLAERRIGDAEQPPELRTRAADGNHPRGPGQGRRQAGGIWERPVLAPAKSGQTGIFPLTTTAADRRASLHGAKFPDRTCQPGHHPLVAEVPPA